MKCEHAECAGRTSVIYMTAEEYASLPVKSGPEACIYIFNRQLGKALCDQHRPNDQAQR